MPFLGSEPNNCHNIICTCNKKKKATELLLSNCMQRNAPEETIIKRSKPVGSDKRLPSAKTNMLIIPVY